MFIFGHIGVTLGILTILKKHPLFSKLHTGLPMVAFGAMLPDIIDKPIGEGIFADYFSNGRIYGHTLLFCLLILMAAVYYYKRKDDNRILVIPAATFLHLVEDRMWTAPQTLFWPLMGWQFPQGYSSSGLLDYFLRILRNTYTLESSYSFLSEILGALILVFIGIRCLQQRSKQKQ
jgi:membrane-bound metal-dependent hydrolase YbcI (DUF457 family)